MKKYNTLLGKGRELQAAYNTLEAEKAEADSRLDQTESSLERSFKHNKKTLRDCRGAYQ